MFASAQGIIVIADLDDAASLVLNAIAQGSFGPGRVAVMTVAERLKPAALRLQGEGRATTRALLADGRTALVGAAQSRTSPLALVGIEFSPNLSAEEEAQAVVAGAAALMTTYNPVIVLNRHMQLAPVLRRTIQQSHHVVIIAGMATPIREVQSFSTLCQAYGKVPMLWFNANGADANQGGALRLSAETGLALWNTSPSEDPAPTTFAQEETKIVMEQREPAYTARIAEAGAVAIPPTLHPNPPDPDRAADLSTVVTGYLRQLEGLRLSRKQLAGNREAVQHLLARMSEALQGGSVPASQEMNDLAKRWSALSEIATHHEQLLRRCQADWNLLHRALDPNEDGAAH